MTIVEQLLSDFRMEAESTRKVLDAVPADRFDWQPHEKSMKLGRLAGHIAEAPTWASAMMGDEFDFESVPGNWEAFVPETKAELMGGFERQAAEFDRLLTGKSDDFMNGSWTMRKGAHVIMTMPRHTALRSTVVRHIVHHRGQLTVYLRLLGVPVPGTYGPTADTPAMV